MIEKFGYDTDAFRKGGRPSIIENLFTEIPQKFASSSYRNLRGQTRIITLDNKQCL